MVVFHSISNRDKKRENKKPLPTAVQDMVYFFLANSEELTNPSKKIAGKPKSKLSTELSDSLFIFLASGSD